MVLLRAPAALDRARRRRVRRSRARSTTAGGSTWSRPLVVVSGVLLRRSCSSPASGSRSAARGAGSASGSWRFQPSELAKLALLLFAADLADAAAARGARTTGARVLRPVLIGLRRASPRSCASSPTSTRRWCSRVIVGAVLVVGGIRAPPPRGRSAAAAIASVDAPRDRRARTGGRACSRSCTRRHDASNTGYQILAVAHRARAAAASTGVGLGAGRAKWHFLPNAHTDFIFAIIGEELGLVGCLARARPLRRASPSLGVRTALRAPDRFGMLLAAGITVWIVGQAAINIGGGGRPAAGVGDPAAVRVVRRLGARVHDDRGRDPRQRRAAGAVDATHVTASDDVFALDHRRRHRRPRVPGARASPTSSCAVATRRDAVRFVGVAPRARGHAPCPAAGYAIDLLPGRGVRRSLPPSALLAERRRGARTRRSRSCARSGSCGGCGRASCSASAAYASLPCVVAARAPAGPGGRARAERGAGPREPGRGAPRRARRGVAARHAAARRGRSPATRCGATIVGRCARDAGHDAAAASWSSAAASAPGALNDAALGLVRPLARRAPTSRSATSPGRATTNGCRGRPVDARAGADDALGYELVAYEDAHGRALRATRRSSVCRAGAVTCAELAAAGMPAVLVPLPGAPGDHQTANADGARAAGAAVVVPDAELRRRAPRRGARRAARRPRPARRRWARPRARSAGPTPPAASPTSSRRRRAAWRRPEPSTASTSRAPRRVHIVGVGGAGDERDRDGARRAWATA